MASRQLGIVLRYLHRLVGAREFADLTDGQLLEIFLSGREEAAFAALVQRHGPMVLGVCARVLQNTHDAEDAFQATFLVLFRRSRFLDRQASLAHWLYTVAYHVALKAKADLARRQRHERQVCERSQEEAPMGQDGSDLQPLIDEEVTRLPKKYRLPILLCYFEGKTHEEAARLLAWPVGTVKGRLGRARALLRTRLARRGIASTPLLSCQLASKAQSAVPIMLVDHTVKTVSFLAAGKPATGLTSALATALAEQVLKAMLITKLKIATAVLLVTGIVGLSVGTLTHQAWLQHKTEIAATVTPAGAAELPEQVKTAPQRSSDQEEHLPVRKLALQSEKSDAGHDPLEAEEVITKSFTTGAQPRAVIETFDGSIDVTTGSMGQTKVKIIKTSRGDSEEAAKENLQNVVVTMSQEANTIRITARRANTNPRTQSGAAVELEVPAGAVLELRTSNGTICLIGPTGNVTAHCYNGAIRVDGSKGNLHLTMSNGTIDVAGSLAEGGHSFQMSNGAIALTLPADAHFRIDAETSQGRITSDFSVMSSEGRSTTRLRGTVGEDPATFIKLLNSNGSIQVRRGK